jgi:hypothetical protein
MNERWGKEIKKKLTAGVVANGGSDLLPRWTSDTAKVQQEPAFALVFVFHASCSVAAFHYFYRKWDVSTIRPGFRGQYLLRSRAD